MNTQPVSPGEIIRACCEDGSEAAWVLFVRTFQPLIASTISRIVGRYTTQNHALIDDLVQDTFLRLCADNARILRQFEARHQMAVFGFIKVIATSVALDHFRARTAQKRSGEIQGLEELNCEPRSHGAKIEEMTLIKEINDNLVSTESWRDRTIFWLYYRHGFSAKEIAAVREFNLTQKGVESCIFRITRSVREFLSSEHSSTLHPVEGKPFRTTLGEVE